MFLIDVNNVCLCKGVEEPRRRTVTQAAESVKMETTAGGGGEVLLNVLRCQLTY